jgi:hypothetical protein
LTIIPGTSYYRSRFLVRWLSGRKQRFAKSKTAFRRESSNLILSLQFQTCEAITLHRFSSRVLLRHLISYRRLTFSTYLFRASKTVFGVHELSVVGQFGLSITDFLRARFLV